MNVRIQNVHQFPDMAGGMGCPKSCDFTSNGKIQRDYSPIDKFELTKHL